MKTGLMRRCAAIAVAMIGLSAAPALASSVDIVGDMAGSTEGLGNFAATLSYEYDGLSSMGVLTVMLTNTSDPGNGGFITGFLFNIASSDDDASAELMDTPAPSHPFEGVEDESGSPFGTFDAGAALGGSFLGGGNPNPGIAVGVMGTFMFEIDADDASLLTAMSFLGGDLLNPEFLVRFRGFDDDGSDKVPGTVVPVPAALPLGLAALGLVVLRRRRG